MGWFNQQQVAYLPRKSSKDHWSRRIVYPEIVDEINPSFQKIVTFQGTERLEMFQHMAEAICNAAFWSVFSVKLAKLCKFGCVCDPYQL